MIPLKINNYIRMKKLFGIILIMAPLFLIASFSAKGIEKEQKYYLYIYPSLICEISADLERLQKILKFAVHMSAYNIVMLYSSCPVYILNPKYK